MNYPASALPTALALVDLDADDNAELVVANETSLPNIVTVLRGFDDRTFAAPMTFPVGGVRPRGVATGDFNADGIPDIVVANYATNNVSTLLADCAPLMNIAPNPNIDLSSSYELRKSPLWFDRTVPGAYTHVVTHTDLNRDGRTDLVRASITGSIIGNLLLVLGASLLVGGLKNGLQTFDRRTAGMLKPIIQSCPSASAFSM